MKLKRLSDKIADYRERLEQGKADQIRPDHVLKVLKKLRDRKAGLAEEMSAASGDDKVQRLERKLKVADEQIVRAEWLLREVTDDAANGQGA